MEYLLPYGRKKISLNLPEKHVLRVLEPKETQKLESLEKTVAEKIARPDEGPSLEEILEAKKPSTVAIIVNDLTRSTPTASMLPPVLEVLEKRGVARKNVVIVIATGTHRGLTEEEKARVVGAEVLASYRVENHDCDAPDLVSLGTLSTGNEVLINPLVAKADCRIALGEVL
ncbi:MAG TPA: lactate racemase domain-containing protein, partial [Synergistaceae bacterium]|nr:lactate racemase domain-containing protein [Synergistaceae bacterium]